VNRLAIFDCDGTLVDSGATIVRAVAETFDAHGLPVPPPRECRQVIAHFFDRCTEELAIGFAEARQVGRDRAKS